MGVSEFKKQAWFQREGRERCSANGAARTAATAMTAHRKVQRVRCFIQRRTVPSCAHLLIP